MRKYLTGDIKFWDLEILAAGTVSTPSIKTTTRVTPRNATYSR
jgi:hypothetical protein